MTALVFLTAVVTAAAERPDLGGTVVDASGKPVRGARVFVYTAAARVGVNPFCPPCYADCRKSAATGDDGRFLIRSLDPNLVFRLLVVGEGFEPNFVEKVDPIKGQVEVKLKPIDPKRLDPRHVVRGRVVAPEGEPVAGAEITPIEFKTQEYSPGVFDPVAVTNLRGEFALTSRSPIEHVGIKVTARGLAAKFFPELSPRESLHEFRLGRGAGVTGRVLHDGKPLPGVVVGLVQEYRDFPKFLGHTEIATDDSGRFLFSNVAPNDRYVVYGVMQSIKPHGSLAAVEVKIKGDETTADLGTLEVKPGHRLSGRVVLADGKPVPPRTHVLVSREKAWDSQMVELDAEGRFTLDGLPTEDRYTLSSSVKGYRLSPRNACANPLNPGLLEGRVDRDVTDLTVLYEPGSDRDLRAADNQSPEFRLAVAEFYERRRGVIRGVTPPDR